MMTIDYTKTPQIPSAPPPPPGPPQQRGWFSRNWGWVVALGCLLPVILLGACVGGIVWFVFSAIKSSDVYTHALEEVRKNPQVVERLGTPIEPGWWITGNIQTDANNTGTADFTAPIKGPKGSATMDVEAVLETDGWRYRELKVHFKDGSSVDLTPKAPSPEESTDTAPPAGESAAPSSNP